MPIVMLRADAQRRRRKLKGEPEYKLSPEALRKRVLEAVEYHRVDWSATDQWEVVDPWPGMSFSLLRLLADQGLIEATPEAKGRWALMRLTYKGRKALAAYRAEHKEDQQRAAG